MRAALLPGSVVPRGSPPQEEPGMRRQCRASALKNSRSERGRVSHQRHLPGSAAKTADLFLASRDDCSDAQFRLFDDLLIKTTKQMEQQALIELSIRVAPQKVPPSMLRNLAQHDSISIAGPVLVNSEQLTDGDLIEIAKARASASDDDRAACAAQ
jgi:hypothetical protein